MKEVYRRHLREILDRRIAESFPAYALHVLHLSKDERQGATLFPGSRLYRRLVSEGVYAFIHMIPHQRQERFNVEVGWSVRGRFPVQYSSRGPRKLPAHEMSEPEWLIDFSELFHRRHGRGHLGWDVWTCSVDIDHPEYMRIFVEEDLAQVSETDARTRVEGAVEVCIRDLEDVAVPYLNVWLQAQGFDH